MRTKFPDTLYMRDLWIYPNHLIFKLEWFSCLRITFNNLIVSGVERSYRSDDTEDAVTTDNPTTPFPTPPPTLVSPRSPIPLHRQASPFPLESINTRRLHFQTSQDRMRGNTNEIIYSTSNKQKLANSTLNRTGRSRHRVGGMTSSSSATSCNSCTDNMMVPNGDIVGYHDKSQQQRLCLNSGR